MKKTTLILSALSILAFGTACKNSGFKKTKSGLLYKIISTGNGAKVKNGDVVKLSYTYTLRDSVLSSSVDQFPFYAKVDSIGPVYDPREIFSLLHKGDSAVVISLADSLVKKQGQLPDFIKPKDKLVLKFRVLEVFTSDSIAQGDRMAEMQKMQQKMQVTKVKEIEDYLKQKNINAQKAPMGTYVEVKQQGTGAQVDSGKYCKILYTGKSFPSMKVFETNTEAGKEPFGVVVGTHAVIPGWDEGLKYFKQGGKGTLYIPFFNAYGAQQGPGGKQFENLVFDVEIVSVSDSAPKQQAMPMPVPPPQQHGAGDGHNH